jgi:hypothetical protein
VVSISISTGVNEITLLSYNLNSLPLGASLFVHAGPNLPIQKWATISYFA